MELGERPAIEGMCAQSFQVLSMARDACDGLAVSPVSDEVLAFLEASGRRVGYEARTLVAYSDPLGILGHLNHPLSDRFRSAVLVRHPHPSHRVKLGYGFRLHYADPLGGFDRGEVFRRFLYLLGRRSTGDRDHANPHARHRIVATVVLEVVQLLLDVSRRQSGEARILWPPKAVRQMTVPTGRDFGLASFEYDLRCRGM